MVIWWTVSSFTVDSCSFMVAEKLEGIDKKLKMLKKARETMRKQ